LSVVIQLIPNQTGGQQYSEAFPFSVPCPKPYPDLLMSFENETKMESILFFFFSFNGTTHL
jgi:hypothetical protein